ncbi:EAL domain-containing protein [Pseudomonas sp. PDM14]|uniref:putative bifunctional diguanylate cyclase/phosphodiesterase n=1 Tax=Pseudomonas sp. PDM14 TaxID=2769288 RepID=UPI00177F96C3|nr:EAL domain-containing protein [Pseudomonas sp. PDM14]MBD9484476.1 EAL domain-containing protein [Pseudomonas sp. PDM14]
MTFSNSFQTRIASVLILLLLVVISALYFAVKAATGVAVHNQLREELGTGGRVFEQLLEVRGRQLHDAVQVLAADFGFKDAVASGDRDTIGSALANHGARINADVTLLLGLDGSLLASSAEQVDAAEATRLAQQMAEQGRSGAPVSLLPINGEVYLLVEASIKAPLPIARVVMGFHVDSAFAAELRELTHLELTLVSIEDGKPHGWVSTLPAVLHERLRDEIQQQQSSGTRLLEQDGQRYLGEWRTLSSGPGYQVLALLHKSVDQAEAAFAPLDHDILLIAIAALCGSLLGALMLARSLSQPVVALAGAAGRIGQGDYRTPIALQRGDELGALAKAFNSMQDGIAERERQLAHNALHDPLTGLPNRTLALERLGSAITSERPTALLHLGMVNFRNIRESCGTDGADQALQQISRRLQATLRPGDTLARLVADEMLMLLENCDSDSAIAAADKLQQLLLKPMKVGSLDISLDCAIGIASFPADGATADELLRRAAIAMQDATQLPGRLQLYQEGRDAAHLRQINLVRDLRYAALHGELLLHYQPKLDIRAGKVREAEALLRWNHPQYGMVSPGEFIPLAERTGSIQLLTNWVIEDVLRQLEEWNARGLHMQVSLNISADDLVSLGLVERVSALLAQHTVDAGQLVFEITESAMMQDPTRALEVLHGLRDCGIHLSVDDFGTGYSSLAQLKRMPVQELKIDQSFIRELDAESDDAVIVRSTIEMSHSLGLRVVAEGVEYAHNLDLLKRWNCDTAQGYLISRPLPAQAFEAWMAQPLVTSLATAH